MKTINVTDEQYEFLMNLSKEINTQDNRITADPIFCVYHKVMTPMPEGCGEEGWINEEGDLLTEEDIKEIVDEYNEEHKNDMSNKDYEFQDHLKSEEEILEELEYRKVNYEFQDTPVSGQPYFSEKAAQNHIDCNHYHYHKPFTYVESAWRNDEWITIRKIIMDLTQKEGNNVK